MLTSRDADEHKESELSDVADVVRLDDLGAEGILHYLRMARAVLVEGGPSLFGQFVAAGLVDEMSWTVAPMLVAGDAPRMAHGPSGVGNDELKLDRVLYGDRSLFLRYLKG